MWGLVSRKIIRSIEKYRNRLDHMLTVTKELREEIYADVILNKIMDSSLSITRSDAGSIFLIEGDNLVFKVVKGERLLNSPVRQSQKAKALPDGLRKRSTSSCCRHKV